MFAWWSELKVRKRKITHSTTEATIKERVENLLYNMAGEDEKFLNKNLLAPHKVIAKQPTAPSPFP